MLQRAIRNRWLDTDELKRKAQERTLEHLESENPRLQSIGVSNVLMMESQNQKDEHKFADLIVQTRNAELAEIASDLGIEESVVQDAESQSGGSIEATSSEDRQG